LSKPQARNDLNAAVPKFCFELEMHRRTAEGRVRTAQEFLAHFFPHDAKSSTDRIFKFLPYEVRGPILTTWGVRGRKSALRDDDGKVQSVVHDSLVAGDIDAVMFEEALAPDVIMRWIDLTDWWVFWRGGKITKYTILRALESGYEAALFDAEWFLDSLRAHGGKLKGTDVLAEGLSKADLTEWVRHIHESGDGSPKGIVTALGWDQIVAKTSDEVLVSVLDAMAAKVALVVPKDPSSPEPGKNDGKAPAKSDAKAESKPDLQLEGKALSKVDAKGDAPPVAALPGILIPSTAVAPGVKPSEETIEGDLAASLFKDDELIPISSGAWDSDSDDEEAAVALDAAARPGRGSKPPPGKRSGSRNPPPLRK
jgi:hypothetical protein